MNFTRGRESCAFARESLGTPARARRLAWAFAGALKQDRRAMLQTLATLTPNEARRSLGRSRSLELAEAEAAHLYFSDFGRCAPVFFAMRERARA